MAKRHQSDRWRLRRDIAWARALLALVTIPGVTSTLPEVHYFLFDRYFRLSELLRERGATRRAEKLRLAALWHYERSGVEGPPPASGFTLPAPPPATFTWAVAGRPKSSRLRVI